MTAGGILLGGGYQILEIDDDNIAARRRCLGEAIRAVTLDEEKRSCESTSSSPRRTSTRGGIPTVRVCADAHPDGRLLKASGREQSSAVSSHSLLGGQDGDLGEVDVTGHRGDEPDGFGDVVGGEYVDVVDQVRHQLTGIGVSDV